MSPSKIEIGADGGFHDFPDLPPFPSDVPIAPLLQLSLKRLQDGDTEESARFIRAAKDLGFFYLDLRNSMEGETILKDTDRLFKLGEDLFQLDLEEKQSYDFSRQGTYYGCVGCQLAVFSLFLIHENRYKGFGQSIVDNKGTTDRNEFYNVSKDDILSPKPILPSPTILIQSRPLLKSFVHSAHTITRLLLGHLTQHLHLPDHTLESLHRLDAVSGDQVRFLKAPPQKKDDSRTALGEHTDFGSITVLFNRLGGLQVKLPPGIDALDGLSENNEKRYEERSSKRPNDPWAFVRPLPFHAIINLGDALTKFSAGIFRSNIHRVVAAPGLQATHTKFSVVYFARPEDDVVLKRLVERKVEKARGEGRGEDVWEVNDEEEEMTSKEWILKRALGRRVGLGDVIKGERDAAGLPKGLGDT